MFTVNVVETDTNTVVKSVECSSERQAEKVEMGILRNMNLEDYHTEIEEK